VIDDGYFLGVVFHGMADKIFTRENSSADSAGLDNATTRFPTHM
jgi:hypothetical protein